MKSTLLLSASLLLLSCEPIGYYQKETQNEDPIASVYNKNLYKSEIDLLLPKNLNTEDSVLLARNLINNWATELLLLKKAEENMLKDENSKVDKLVEEYRQALLINGYKERLINQQLDTLIGRQEIEEYYRKNAKNFRSNEELIKTRYIHFSNNLNDKEEIIAFFKKGTIEYIEALELMQLTFKSAMLNDSVWVPLNEILQKMPFSREALLKKGEFYQKEDSLEVYLIAIKDVLLRNEVAPLSYIQPTIKQMILHQRKLELIRDIEKIILKDAIQNKIFRTY